MLSALRSKLWSIWFTCFFHGHPSLLFLVNENLGRRRGSERGISHILALLQAATSWSHGTWQIMKRLKALLWNVSIWNFWQWWDKVAVPGVVHRLKFSCSLCEMFLFLHVPQAAHLHNLKSLLLVPEGITALDICYCLVYLSAVEFPSIWIKNWVCLIEKICFCLLTERFLTLSPSLFTDIW